MILYDHQIITSLGHNAMALELKDQHGNVVADINKRDSDNRIVLNTFGNDLEIQLIQEFLALALRVMGPFEDGTPLDRAAKTQSLLRR